jgi:hypothetical protein
VTTGRWGGAAALLLLAALGAALFPGALRVSLVAGSVVLLVAAAAGAFGNARSLRAPHRSPFDDLAAPEPSVARPGDLGRLERMLGWKEYSAQDFDHRVAPVLTRILTSRLAARGVDPAAHPDTARRVAGPALQRLLDPPADGGPTVDTAEIAAMVDALEEL